MSSAAWQIRQASPSNWRSDAAIDNLFVSDVIPKPAPSELTPKSVLVRIRAASINARDMLVISRDPFYTHNTIPNLTPCADGAGEVEAVGEGSKWKIGEKVMITPGAWEDGDVVPDDFKGKGSGSVQGTLRQDAVLEDSHLISVPSHLSFEEAASMPTAGGTAMNALLFGPVPVKKGMTVLTQGTGGVSCFAIQIAAAIGATVIATSSSDAKLEAAKELGAVHTINYVSTPRWEKVVLDLSHGEGVDHVLEVGGGSTIEQSVECTKRGGLISLVGFLTGGKKVNLIGPLVFGSKTLRGVTSIKKKHGEKLLKLFEEHNIHPLIGQIFEWEQVKDAFRKSMERALVGKVVVKV